MDMVFDVMFKNERTAHVEVKGSQVLVESYSENPFIQPFQMPRPNIFDVHEFFVDRWYEPSRPDYWKLCEAIGVPDGNIYEIVRRNHGVCMEDMTWVRFEGETDITWEDLAPARE